MKLIKLCVICIPFLLSAAGCAKPKSSDYPIISPDKVVAMWLFDEDHKEIAYDSSGNGHDGALMALTTRVPGKFGTALQFGGAGDAVVVPDFGESVPASEVTVAAWIKLEEIKNHDLFSLVPISRVGHWRPDILDRFTVHFPWNRPYPNMIHWQFGGEQIWMHRPSETLGRWEHWAFVCSASQKFMKIYRNGSEVAWYKSAGQYSPRIADLHIGGRPRDLLGGTPGGTFGGIIDEFAVFNVALNEREIVSLMGGIQNAVTPMEP
ncbi:MAG: hypothetical protein OXP71_00115 [Candidatus Poribacteria bacterium]|nr:hypothetical protein [Candidatus Poribacteria bacterium]